MAVGGARRRDRKSFIHKHLRRLEYFDPFLKFTHHSVDTYV